MYGMPDMVEERWGHSIEVVGVCGNCVWVMVTEGHRRVSWDGATTILFELSELCNVTNQGWQQQLKVGGMKCCE